MSLRMARSASASLQRCCSARCAILVRLDISKYNWVLAAMAKDKQASTVSISLCPDLSFIRSLAIQLTAFCFDAETSGAEG